MLLSVQNIAMRFPDVEGGDPRPVLRDVSFSLDRGQSLAILGPSGCGKSTLLNIIGTLEKPTAGSVTIEGVDTSAMNDRTLAALRNEKIGFVFQDHHLLPQCSVLENVLVPTLVHKNPDGAADRARRLLERVDLKDHLHHRPGQLSGGQRQRVAVVRALINRPALLLADEPSGALDRASAANLAQLLIELNREENVTLIVVTHAPDLAAGMAQQLTLADGALQPT
jgi:lipoprotein-releasing system ATP-binding protein